MTALIVWYRDDLRVSDHPPCTQPPKSHASVVVSFTCSTTERRAFGRSAARRAGGWRSRCARLQASLRERGASLVLRKGPAPAVIAALAREAGADAVYWNEIAQAPHQAVADQVAAALSEIGIASQRFPGDLLASPSQIRNKENRGLRVFTPFWRRVQALGDPPKPLPAPKTLERRGERRKRQARRLEARADPAGLGRRPARHLDSPARPPRRRGSRRSSTSGIAGYSGDRDRPDRDGTSRLSPHLRFGEISPRQIWHAARFAAAEHPRPVRRHRQSSSANSAGASSAGICCSTCPISPRATCSPASTPFPGSTTTRPCAPGSAA